MENSRRRSIKCLVDANKGNNRKKRSFDVYIELKPTGVWGQHNFVALLLNSGISSLLLLDSVGIEN